MHRRLRIFFSTGDPSGDIHGANLIRALRERSPELEPVGLGGPKMAAAGCELLTDLTMLAVIGFVKAIRHVPTFWRLLKQAEQFFEKHRPDAVVLIDYPGFNWHVAKAAKRRGIPVFYFCPPQVWAWAQHRVKKMRRNVDCVLCALPFERDWYAERGCHAVLVGHPFFDEVLHHQNDEAFLAEQRAKPGRLVTILPGSRSQEIENNLRSLLKAATHVRDAVPDARFAVAAFKPKYADAARQAAEAIRLPLEIHVGKTPELMQAAHSCLAVSGSVSLELLCHTKPTVIMYQIHPISYALQRQFRRVRYITLVNLLAAPDPFEADTSPYDPKKPGAEQVLFPEYATFADRSRQMAAHVIEWLNQPEKHAALRARLAELKARVCHPGATDNAAAIILEKLSGSVPRPHFAGSRSLTDKQPVAPRIQSVAPR